MQEFSLSRLLFIYSEVNALHDGFDNSYRTRTEFVIPDSQFPAHIGGLKNAEVRLTEMGFSQSVGLIPGLGNDLLRLGKKDDQAVKYASNDCFYIAERARRLLETIQFEAKAVALYSVRPDMALFYGRKEGFGAEIQKKFPAATEDIEHAGNCLALGEPTACVLHLMRAMESALRHLSRRLHAPLNPKDTWGGVLNKIDPKINAMPEKTERQKAKKSQWSQARSHLWHVKVAWRDDSMHGKATYTDEQAKDVMNAVRAFMGHLATL